MDQLEDAFRYQIEDSDVILGFNMYCDTETGFGAVAE